MHSNQLGTKNLKPKKKKVVVQKKQQNYIVVHKIRNGEPSAQNKKWRAKAYPFQCVWHGSKINHNHISLIKSSWRKV